MKKHSLSLSLCVLAVLLSLACATKPDDAKVSSDIQNKFSQDSGLSTKQLTVQASNGVVTLGGLVDNDAQRQAASQQAASIGGVKQVVNNLQVGDVANAAISPSPAKPNAAETKSTRSKSTEKHASARSRD